MTYTVADNDIPQNHLVEVKGFLFRDQSGQVVLSNTPNMRSCCVGKESIAQLYLKGEFPDQLPSQMTVIRGKLNEKTLEDASIVSGSSYGLTLFLLIPMLIFILSNQLLRKRQ